MPESAYEVHARVTAATTDGRLPVPSFVDLPAYPFEVVGGALAVRRLPEPSEEGPRQGEGGRPCPVCETPPHAIWQDDTWRVKPHPRGRSGLPVVLFLETHEHVDYDELDDARAAQLGVLSVRLARAVESLPEIGRCHVHRYGDGCSHVHVWFMGRTAGLAATRGSFTHEWDDILPPVPEDVWRADLATVARTLAAYGGEALV